MLLALETSTHYCNVGLTDGEELWAKNTLAPQSHGTCLVPSVEALLQEAGVEKKAIEAIAYGEGPGSFTGVRIAAAVAQGMAMALDVPLVAVDSLKAVAYAAYQKTSHGLVEVLMDARMGEFYAGVYDFNHGLVQAPRLVKKSEIQWHPERVYSGSGLALLEVPEWLIQVGLDYPPAEAVAALGWQAWLAGETRDLALPVYLRNQVADKPKTP